MGEYSDETLAVLKLALCKGVSSRTIFAVLKEFGSPLEALAAPPSEIAGIDGISESTAQAIRKGPDPEDLATELELAERHRVRIVPFFSEDYPRNLSYLEEDAPALLWMRGDCLPRDQIAVAVVGARRCTAYGRNQATRIACDLATMGFTVVSGMAYGIDSAAHRGALQADGRTFAILGSGLGHEMNERSMELADSIAEAGAVLSEYPMRVPPLPGNFPPRNRIISGLSLATVVVEAASRSGSLITARLAAEQGKAVFAVPGNVDSPASRGCHRLIRDGAVLVESARDVAEGLGPLAEPIVQAQDAEPAAERKPMEDARVLALNDRERAVFELLGSSPMHIDEVVTQTELPISVVASTLLTLEIRGLLKQVGGQRYSRA